MNNDLTLEKMKIVERLGKVEINIGELKARDDERWKNNNLKLTELKDSIDNIGIKIDNMLPNCIIHTQAIKELQDRKPDNFALASVKFLWAVIAIIWGAIIVIFKKGV